MTTKLREMTDYMRRAVATQGSRPVDFKKDLFVQITAKELEEGKSHPGIFTELTKERGNVQDLVPVFIAAKTIKTNYSEQTKEVKEINDLTAVYFIPALLSKDGYFKPYDDKDKKPWIPREFLTPNIDSVLAVGDSNRLDDFLSNNVGKSWMIGNWTQYLVYAKELFEYTTKVTYESRQLENGEQLDENIYVFNDKTINATKAILSLYDHMLRGTEENSNDSILRTKVPTYENFVSLESKPVKDLVKNELDQMKRHVGQMGGEYPLSPSQRECINHFVNMDDTDILAVNGPPGTGKTTLLQSIVADTYVKRALAEAEPPIIVASSTNNQAVTNIIESFGNINKVGLNNLEERWITGVHSFATYFPSSSSKDKAEKNGYQYTNQKGNYFVEKIETEKNITDSRVKFQSSFIKFFDLDISFNEMGRKLNSELKRVNQIRMELLTITSELGKHIKHVTVNQCIDNLSKEKKDILLDIEETKNRLQEWKDHFKNIPILNRMLWFILQFRRKIILDNMSFVSLGEEFLEEDMSIDGIKYKYACILKELRNKARKRDEIVKEISNLQIKYNLCLKELKNYLDDKELNRFNSGLDISEINDVFDTTLRYIQFWLAVHYYEHQWLSGVNQIPITKKHTTFEDVLNRRYKRLAMLTPCFVMTFFQLPKNFSFYVSEGSEKYGYFYNYIDLLIVDEAGQVSPEIAACSFALANKALVVGDVYQIQPVWNISKPLDKVLAVCSNVIDCPQKFDELERLGLNTSESSVMKVAAKSCKYEKYGNKGLFLSEHRRCYDEIIQFCNELVYNSKLEPKREKGVKDQNYKIRHIPHMGYKQIDTQKSSKKCGSRFNYKEAEEIVLWVKENFSSIKDGYKNEEPKNLLGIITPFKAQADCIQKLIKKIAPEITEYISVGTVHTFQGAERKIIILSTVYGYGEDCSFIDSNESMLNVAISRAKDSFLVFGDLNCLSNDPKKPSGLLRYNVVAKGI
ncbi:DNA helicase [Alkalicella caledoniensis]|uniref:DNA helicase n=1 Tax=Alkalicella caledoniensis TaxID=2731377 RepID=A0A7G9WB74_ALKCA|nr:AAA domain-containing protein [Alkalicella caledoniensis]QNO15936.1 DNA helicase [Alkalicella caledoniensis]